MSGGLQQETNTAFPLVAVAAAAGGPETVKRDVPIDGTFATNPAPQQRELPPVIAQPVPQRPAQQYSGAESLVTNPLPPAQASALPPSQDPFLAGGAGDNLTRHDSNYAGWMAPAAVGAAGGAAAVGTGAYSRQKREEAEARADDSMPDAAPAADGAGSPAAEAGVLPLPPVSTQKSPTEEPIAASSPVEPILTTPITSSAGRGGAASASILSASTAATELTESPPRSRDGDAEAGHTLYDTARDGSVNARPTGRWPVLRHDTDVSVRDLHVPGEFPRGGAGGL